MGNVVVGFDSEPVKGTSPQGNEIPSGLEYEQVYDALHHRLEIAENVLARSAKRHVIKSLEQALAIQRATREEATPRWVWDISTIFSLSPSKDDHLKNADKKLLSIWLHRLTESLVSGIRNTTESGPVILIDSLQVKIMEVGPYVYRFQLKQLWALGESDE
jgi:hypothetical protein